MKNKRYILMVRIKDNKYDDFYRYVYKLFESYLDLQKHLKKFWFVEKNNYVVFEETTITKDYSLCDVKTDYMDYNLFKS